MEHSKQRMIDDQFFGSGYKIQTTTSLTARKIANDFEIEQLMIPEKLTPLERFKYILENGSNLQKWSCFQNISITLKESKHIKPVVDLMMNTTKEYVKQLLGVMGYGLTQFMQNTTISVSAEDINSIIQLSFKIFSYEQPSIADEWVKLLKVTYKKNPGLLKKVQEFACESFDFKATEHRRRIGIMLIQQFFQNVLSRDKHSQKFRKQTIKKLLLFFQDQNKYCRQSICNTFEKFLKSGQSEQVWKVVLDYSKDQQSQVRQSAYKILTTIYRSSNFQTIVSIFQDKQTLPLISPMLPNFLRIFNNQIRSQNVKNMFLNIMNSKLKGKGEGLSLNCVKNIVALSEIYGFKFIVQLSEQLIKAVSQNQQPSINNNFIILFSLLSDENKTLDLRNTFYQVLKSGSYVFGDVAKELVQSLASDNQTDLDICLKLCSKAIEFSHWNAEKIYLTTLKQWKFTKLFFDRVVLLIIKHLTFCPQFLNQPIFEMIKHVLCSNKKKRDFLFTLKDRMANNKSWVQRRNYIQIYQYLYKHCSWQMMSQIAPLPMYIFINQKVLNIKLQHCKFISSVYQYINPTQKNVKQALKQYLIKYSEDKNALLTQYALGCLKNINKIQSTIKAEDIFKRNNLFLEEQNQYEQVQDQSEVKQITTYKALVNSKQNLSTTKKTETKETKKVSVNIGKQITKQFSTELKKGTTRNSAVIRPPTVPVSMYKVTKKTDKK